MDQSGEGSVRVCRRRVLSTVVGSVVGTMGLTAMTGTSTAWEREIADFRGCSEVWIVVGERDLPGHEAYSEDYPEHLSVTVIVDHEGEAVCHTVPVVDELVTTIPGQYGDSPVIKYRAVGTDAILGVLWLSPAGAPRWLARNDHRCAQTPSRPSVYDADCVPESIPTAPPNSTGESEPGEGSGLRAIESENLFDLRLWFRKLFRS